MGPTRFPVLTAEYAPARFPVSPEGKQSPHEYQPLGLGDLIAYQHFEVSDEEIADASNTTLLSSYKDETWDDFTKTMMLASCAFFAQEVLTGPTEPPYNGRFLVSEHHESWDDLIVEAKRLCVLAARDHSKTYFFDFAYPIWKAYFQPRGKGFIFSSTAPQAQRILGDIKEEIENNPKLQWLVPDRKEIWSNSQIKLSNGHIIYARGFGTRVRGAHPCLAYSTEIVTERGVEFIGDLVGQTRWILTGKGTWKEARFWKTGTRETVTAQFGHPYTRDKQKLITTPDHRVLTETGWKPVGHLEGGSALSLPESGHNRLFEFMGWLWNDGNYSHAAHTQRVYFSEKDGEALQRYLIFLTKKPHAECCVYRVAKSKIQPAIDVVGYGHRKPTTEKQPPTLVTAEQKTAWIRGMFSANGTVVRSVRLKLASLPMVEYVERVLHEFGVRTTPIVHATDLNGFCSYTIHVHKKSLSQYLAVFGFVQSYKTEKAKALAFPFFRLQEIPRGRRPRKTKVELQDVFDFQVLKPSCELEMSAISNGVIVHNCWIVVDDGLNDETAYSELVRTKQIEYFYTAITNMIVPDGQIIVVGTPFSLGDLYSDLAQNPEYTFRRYPAIDKKTGEALWPDRYDKERLERRKNEIGVLRFQREFCCIALSDETSLFPGWLFKGEKVEMFNATLGMPLKYWQEAGIVGTFMGVDIALSAQASADYFVVWCMGLDKFGNRYILDIDRQRGLPYQEQLSHINRIARKYQCGLVYIEANQMQSVWGDELIRTTDLPIKKFVTTAQGKNALDKGVPSLRILLENGKFRIPRGDARSIELTDVWIEEMRSFGWYEGKLQSVGTHDDLVLATWICDQACRMGAFSFSFGDEEGMTVSQEELDKELGIDGENGSGEDGRDSGNGGASGNLVDDDMAKYSGAMPDPYGF